jgi:hypothetical protein
MIDKVSMTSSIIDDYDINCNQNGDNNSLKSKLSFNSFNINNNNNNNNNKGKSRRKYYYEDYNGSSSLSPSMRSFMTTSSAQSVKLSTNDKLKKKRLFLFNDKIDDDKFFLSPNSDDTDDNSSSQTESKQTSTDEDEDENEDDKDDIINKTHINSLSSSMSSLLSKITIDTDCLFSECDCSSLSSLSLSSNVDLLPMRMSKLSPISSSSSSSSSTASFWSFDAVATSDLLTTLSTSPSSQSSYSNHSISPSTQDSNVNAKHCLYNDIDQSLMAAIRKNKNQQKQNKKNDNHKRKRINDNSSSLSNQNNDINNSNNNKKFLFDKEQSKQPNDCNQIESSLRHQQKLLERISKLGSSPITAIQAIAAKALNFKLKNSSMITCNEDGSDLSSSTSATPFLNINKTDINYDDDDDDEFIIFKTSDLKSNTKISINDGATTSKSTSTTFQQQQQQQQLKEERNESEIHSADSSSNFFSSLKYWMSRRVDSLNTLSNTATTSPIKKQINDLQIKNVNELFHSDCDSDSNISNKSFISFKETASAIFDDTKNNNDHLSVSLSVLNEIINKIESDNQQKEIKIHKTKQNSLKSLLSHYLSKHKKVTKNDKLTLPKIEDTRRSSSSGSLVESLKLTNLQYLSLKNLGTEVVKPYMLNSLLKNINQLVYLDITNCCFGLLTNKIEIRDGDKQKEKQLKGHLQDGLEHVGKTLTHLIMADLSCEDISGHLEVIIKMKNLNHLDISSYREHLPRFNEFPNASLILATIVYNLRHLKSLDISGTNLGGPIVFKDTEEIVYIKRHLRINDDSFEPLKSGICGLMFLNNERRRLDFLGCFACDSAAGRSNIPADIITGENDESQLYAALEYYLSERPVFLLDALNHLFEMFKEGLIEDKLFGGHLIMNVMERHVNNPRIQISGSASLFYVLKYWKEVHFQLPVFYLKRLINTVIYGMEEHIEENAMRRNCVLIMCRLNLPDDVLFISFRLIKILLKIFNDYIDERNKEPSENSEHFVLRTAMHLLNIIACSVHGKHKSTVGCLAIPVAMDLIKTKIKFKEPDDILEVTWSFLWNITDETPENCEIFLDQCEGMSAFMDCIEFKKTEIIRNMMGLLGNVAEVTRLRDRLCKSSYVTTFRQLLFHTTDGLEIAYNSAGVLVHLMSDGDYVWSLYTDCSAQNPRSNVIEDIETAIDEWDLKSERNINYRSFEPIFKLVNQYHNPICQRWACWALANLTTVYRKLFLLKMFYFC